MTPVLRPACHFLLMVLFLLAATVRVSAGGEDTGETKRRLAAAEREIGRLRDSLHEAHRELGAKAERIADLERALESTGRGGTDPGLEPRKASVKTRKPRAGKPEAKPLPEGKRSSSSGSNEPEMFVVTYAAKSAVNYDGRNEALAWVKARLEESPSATFTLTAWANDTEFPETNLEVAGNRARYLADYLVLSGIDGQRLACEVSRGSREGDAGRQVVIRRSESRRK